MLIGNANGASPAGPDLLSVLHEECVAAIVAHAHRGMWEWPSKPAPLYECDFYQLWCFELNAVHGAPQTADDTAPCWQQGISCFALQAAKNLSEVYCIKAWLTLVCIVVLVKEVEVCSHDTVVNRPERRGEDNVVDIPALAFLLQTERILSAS